MKIVKTGIIHLKRRTLLHAVYFLNSLERNIRKHLMLESSAWFLSLPILLVGGLSTKDYFHKIPTKMFPAREETSICVGVASSFG